jgi:hypothetical protein
MHSFKILFSCFLLLVGLKIVSAVERYQIDPNLFHEINLRYDMLKGSEVHSPLIRPWYFSNTQEEASLLFQLQPSLIPYGNSQDVSINSWIQLRLNKCIVVVNEMHLNYASQNDPSYIGKEWRSISGLTNQSFFHWNKKMGSMGDMALQVGRFYSQLGPGRHGQLLLGASPRPMDQLSLSLEHAISKNLAARFFFQTSALDKIGPDNRFMSLHRLEVSNSRWYIALSEALTYTRDTKGMDLVYLNPFIFYHLEQLNGPELLGNTIGTLEIGYKWNTSHIYSEIIIDDVQFDNEVKGDLEPNEVGGLLGYEHAGDSYYLSIEGVALTNRTYKTPNPSEWFLHRNIPIGYELGSDVARLNILSRYFLHDKWHIDTEIDLMWQGEGNFLKAWDAPWENDSITMETGYSEPFPTGIVEKSVILSTEVMRHWNRERWISLGVSYVNINNVDNIQDEKHSGLNLHLSASWTFEYEAIFKQ